MNDTLVELFSVVLFFVGFYGIISSKGVIKSIVSISVMEVSLVVFFLSIGFKPGMKPPIGQEIVNAADPLPQALVITAIIIGVALTSVNLTMLISLSRQYNATEWDFLSNVSRLEQTVE